MRYLEHSVLGSWKKSASHSGYMLIEVIVALGLVTIYTIAFAQLSMNSLEIGRIGQERTIAANYALEGMEAMRSIAQENYRSITDGIHGLNETSTGYTISGTGDVLGRYTRTIEVLPVYRNEYKEIVTEGGTPDEDSKGIRSKVTWMITQDREDSVEFFSYFMYWRLTRWMVDLYSEMFPDYRNSTLLTKISDGEIQSSPIGNLKVPSAHFATSISGSPTITAMQVDPERDLMYFTTLEDGGSAADFLAYDIADVSHESFTLHDSLNLGAGANGFALDRDYAYVITDDSNAEISVIRLSDFQEVATWNIPAIDSEPQSIAIDEQAQKLFVGSGEEAETEEFFVLDISDPEAASIQILVQKEIGTDVNAVSIAQGHAYLATNETSAELQIINTSTYADPAECNLLEEQEATAVYASGTRLFIGRSGGVQSEFIEHVIDASDPDDCNYITSNVAGETQLGSDNVMAFHINLEENFATVLSDDSSEELRLIYFSDYQSTDIDLAGNLCDSVTFHGIYVYAGCRDSSEGIQVLKGGKDEWDTPVQVGDGDVPGNKAAIAVGIRGKYAYIGMESSSGDDFYIFDISSPQTGMDPIASLEIGADVNNMFIMEDKAYLATDHDSREMIVVDISTPTAPYIEAWWDDPGSTDALSVAVYGTGAYLTMRKGDEELRILDIGDLTDINEVGSYSKGDNINDIYVEGDIAFIATSDNSEEVMTLDVSDPQNVQVLDTYDTYKTGADAKVIAFMDAYLYVGSDKGGNRDDFFILDVTDPSNIQEISTMNFDSNNLDVTVDNYLAQYVFVASRQPDVVRVIDITDPANPEEIGSLSFDGDCTVLVFYNRSLALGCTSNSKELQFVQQQDLSGYARWATYTTAPLDTGDEPVRWLDLSWADRGEGDIKLRIRTADTEAGLASATWVGSDGTFDTYYEGGAEQPIVLDPSASGDRWIQWKAYLMSNGFFPSILDDVLLTYE